MSPQNPLVAGPAVAAPPVHWISITIVPGTTITKVLAPPPGTPALLGFQHPQGTAVGARPFEIGWRALNLNPGERIEIRLNSTFPGYEVPPPPFKMKPWWEFLKQLFPAADVLASGAFGFELTHQLPQQKSGIATTSTRFEIKRDANGRSLIHYDIVFYDAQQKEHVIDPDVDVEPDP